MTPALLRQVGGALHGERWQTPLARELGVSDRTVRRWLAGDAVVPTGLCGAIMRGCLRDRLLVKSREVEAALRAIDAG